MKIIIPTQDINGLDSFVEHHFGKAPYFAVIDRESREVEFVLNGGSHHGGARTPAQILLDHKPDVVVCTGMGPRAVDILRSGGVEVMMGAKNTVGATLDALDAGGLFVANADHACKDHRH